MLQKKTIFEEVLGSKTSDASDSWKPICGMLEPPKDTKDKNGEQELRFAKSTFTSVVGVVGVLIFMNPELIFFVVFAYIFCKCFIYVIKNKRKYNLHLHHEDDNIEEFNKYDEGDKLLVCAQANQLSVKSKPFESFFGEFLSVSKHFEDETKQNDWAFDDDTERGEDDEEDEEEREEEDKEEEDEKEKKEDEKEEREEEEREEEEGVEDDNEDDEDDDSEEVQSVTLIPFNEERLGVEYRNGQAEYKFNSEYFKQQLVGQGSFGRVYRIMDAKKRTVLALKVISFGGGNCRELEVQQMAQGSPYILPVYGAAKIGNKISIFMPLAQGGSLKSYLHDFQKSTGLHGFNVKLVCHFLYGLMAGLKHLHKKGIIHRDIKSDNVLMFSDSGGALRAVISDFGLAIQVNNQQIDKLYGTPQYASPEAVKGRRLSYSTDIWSAGCVLREMDTGDPPWKYFASFGPSAVLYRVGNLGEPPIPDNCSDVLLPLYNGMLCIDSRDRMTAVGVLRFIQDLE
eukprot:gene3494-3993_t